MAAAYLENALADPHLYAVMFGTASLGGYRLHDEELDVGLAAFGQLVGGRGAGDGRWAPCAATTRPRSPGRSGRRCTAT